MSLEPLWEPLKIGDVTIKNRVALTAHAIAASPDNLLGQRSIDYYLERAKGGIGLIMTEAQMVHPSGKGMILTAQEGWRDEAIDRFRALMDAIRPYGTKVFAEIGHMGPPDENMIYLDNFRAVLSPSGIPPFNTNEMPKPMEAEDFAALTDGFVKTARNVKAGGVDGIEIHAAHGFLLSSFLSPGHNRRTDQYGGSTENRCRFLIEIATAVRAEIGPGFPLGVRLSFEEFTPDGIHAAEGRRIVELLHATGLFDYFSISGGHLVSVHTQISPMGVEAGLLDPFAAQAREIVDVPVLAVNRITTVEQAAQLIRSGTADLVGMVRAHMADPHLVAKAQSGQLDLIRECVSCNQGCVGRLFKGRAVACTINPVSAREGEWGAGSLVEVEHSRHVVVVGGGPAGMKAAEVAAARGHQVTLFERSSRLGGALRSASMLPNRDRWQLLIQYFERTLDHLGVEVKLGAEVTIESLASIGADVIVLATGATYDKSGYSSGLGFRETIPGLPSTTVLDPTEAIADPDRCGKHVVIVDDATEYLGLGLADHLAEGRSVELVTRHMFAGADTITTGDLGHLYPRVRAKGVAISAQHFIADVAEGKATIAEIWGGMQHVVEVDSIVLNMQRQPEVTLYDQLRASYTGEVHRIGDCAAPRHVDEAIYEGEKLGRTL